MSTWLRRRMIWKWRVTSLTMSEKHVICTLLLSLASSAAAAFCCFDFSSTFMDSTESTSWLRAETSPAIAEKAFNGPNSASFFRCYFSFPLFFYFPLCKTGKRISLCILQDGSTSPPTKFCHVTELKNKNVFLFYRITPCADMAHVEGLIRQIIFF